MAEVAKKIAVVKETVKRERKHKDISLTEITPSAIFKILKLLYALIMIPISLIDGIIEGICYGFQKGLEVALELYKKEMGK